MLAPRVCLVIPTHNSSGTIDGLLQYVARLDLYKIYVIDDASDDNTVAICQQYPQVEVIHATKNVGPTRNRNRVLGKDLGDITIFLDDDMRLRKGSLVESALHYFSNPELAVLGFGVYTRHGKEIWFDNEFETNPLFFWARMPFINRLSSHERRKPLVNVQWVLEGAFAIRSNLFTTLDGFDERFRRYHEGPDLCRRVRKRGYQIGYTNDVQFTHLRPLSMFGWRQFGYFMRSSILWHFINFGKIKLRPGE